MRKVSVDDVEPSPFGSDVDVRRLSDPLGTTEVSINRYSVEPGKRLSGGLHAHVDQEEVFVVVEGQATFETLAPRSGVDRADGETASEGGEVVVRSGEAIRFAPGEFQSGKNDSDEALVVYALGAPRDTEDVRVPLACSECGRGDLRPTVPEDGGGPVLVCPDCGGESAVECPECGGDDMRVILADDGETPVDACVDCGGEFEAR